MPLVIDCYNVLHETMPPLLAGLDEAGLCAAVARTAWIGGGVTVVADGRPKPRGATRSPVDGVELVFSGAQRTADEVIIAMIDANTAPRRITVVSTDREIRDAARRRRAKVLTAERFIARLTTALTRKRSRATPRHLPKPDPGKLPPEAVDRWLAEFGYAPPPESPPPPETSLDDDDEDLEGIWPPW